MKSQTERELAVIKAAQEMAERHLQELAKQIADVLGAQSEQVAKSISGMVEREAQLLAEELWKAEMLKVEGFQA